jgi:hypothetical protein
MRSLLALWLITLLTHCSFAQTKKPNLSAGKDQQAQTAQRVPDNPPPSPPRNTQSTSPPSAQGAQNSGPAQDEKAQNNRIVWFTGVLAGVGFLQLFAMIFQYCAMRTQAAHMHRGLGISIRAARAATRNAIAAKKNADALINAERAWITGELVLPDGKLSVASKFFIWPPKEAPVVTIRLKLSNPGKTPAWIIGTWELHDVTDDIPENPKEPGGEPESGPEPIAAGGETFADLNLICPGFGSGDRNRLLIYGITKYRDCFEIDHITTFGYTLTARGELDRVPDPAYNRFT